MDKALPPGSRFGGTIVINGTTIIPGGPPQYTLVETDPVELHVRPLPSEGELPGFTGAIGSFELGPPRLATNVVRVGDVVTLTVTVTNRGDGPLARLVAPPAPRAADWQVFAPTEVAPPMAVPLGLAALFGADGEARGRHDLQLHADPAHGTGARHAGHPVQLF